MRFKFCSAWKLTRKSVFMSIAFAFCLIISAIGVWIIANATLPQKVNPPLNPIHVNVRIIGNDWNIVYEVNSSYNNTAFSILLEAARNNHISMTWENWTVPADTVFVVSINNDINGNGGKLWQFWINNVYGSVSANHAQLYEGDMVEWRFAPYPP